ncbi:hypothetical protein HPB51_004914 [Rhipicephalus microplus]|uniref:DDE-1 domain-containing protein n=1 Tax=Rhipicephalus microplus TaxID=6941 RepID=A0A9J6EG60_RHIMP|nr:hypothetical protein HPB51_004914 [Rhipicephalus microplus]
MLVLDALRGHLTADVKGGLSEGKTHLVVILQPLDAVLNKPFKYCVCELYNEWILGNNPKNPAGRLRCRQLATVCGWVSSAWKSFPEKMVRKSFRKHCISKALDGTEDVVLWDVTSEKQTSSD